MAESGLVAQVVRLGRLLRTRGIDVGVADDVDGVRALQLVDLLDGAEVRRALRVAFKVRRRHWPQFDRAFEEVWLRREPDRGTRGAAAASTAADSPAARAPRAVTRPFSGGSNPAFAGLRALSAGSLLSEPIADDDFGTGERPGYSPARLLRKRPFEQCSPDDLDAMTRLLERHVLSLATRRSRRLTPADRAGVVDMRRSLRLSLATGGEPVVLARRARRVEVPRLVVLCDTSGSMDAHSRFLLTFAIALKRVVPHVEVFAFNTSLTRLSPWLVAGDVARTWHRITDAVADWSGGTKIGESFSEFVRSHLDELVNRKTIVAIFSDGLDRGDSSLVADAMESIHARAHRVVWLNPLAGDRRFEPTARAMQAAMPFVDCLASAHNLESLERVLSELTTFSPMRPGARGFLS